MGLNEALNYILYTVLTVILPVVAAYAVNLIKTKINESNMIAENAKNGKVEQILKNTLSDVADAVLYVNQTYTDSLKQSGKFDADAQKAAFEKAYAKAVSLISGGTQSIIEELYGSFDRWLELKIEASVNSAKRD